MAYFTSTNKGILNESGSLISYDDAIKTLELGQYDNELVKGLYLAAFIFGELSKNLKNFTPEQHLSVWRWVVAASFILKLQEKNGIRTVIDDAGKSCTAIIYSNGKATLTVYPLTLRLALVADYEATFIQAFGKEQGTDLAIRAYVDLLNISVEHGPSLSSKGQRVLSAINNDYIRILEAEGGVPVMPTIH
ncbi:hypothetical protein [Providencia heimbachae]|uniref:Uncharacterized protein n=1 Tax=Providencia heimbachae ATCC 35613 TaxID=1354272 RepID=A0A1B7K1K1_9GAMM|nr:hypothetical protein [Providencia heimbachae]OAT54016.1 hypothetical protein M998_0697 [Providencia heimbachae ATCC 35613]SQH13755.1 Uncharacterised protein [Providencia heimbachae]